MRTLFIVSCSLGSFLCNAQGNDAILLKKSQYDLATTGREFLLREAQNVSFFLIGELHGSQEVPQLLYDLWPELNKIGYSHIAAEVSPWAAEKLEFGKRGDTLKTEGLWTNHEAQVLKKKTRDAKDPVLWGCDMEEISLEEMIADAAQKKTQTSLIASSINVSRRIDSARRFGKSRITARLLRENLMKENFTRNYRGLPKGASKKILLRFGRNHLHRGFDSRGISTLGNFVSELAMYENIQTFNVGMFAAGGQCKLMNETFDADERADDLAFQYLWEQASYDGTIFDLRPLRIELHRIPGKDLTDLQKRLLYWANSYDALICLKTVTPR